MGRKYLTASEEMLKDEPGRVQPILSGFCLNKKSIRLIGGDGGDRGKEGRMLVAGEVEWCASKQGDEGFGLVECIK